MPVRPVLIIEDNRAMRELADSVLTSAGFEVQQAPDGPSGIKLAQTVHPAVILLDMTLSGLDGVRTCQRLKQDGTLADIPVIGITVSSDLEYAEQAFRAGAEFCLPKPFEAESLIQVVTTAARRGERQTPRRGDPRLPAELPVRCGIGEDGGAGREVTGMAVNASLRGLHLFLSEKLAPGTTLRLHLELPKGTVIAEAEVMWQSDEVAHQILPHGVHILRFLEDSGFLQYRRYLKALAAASTP
jgi:CheY-like chemotaxis protein